MKYNIMCKRKMYFLLIITIILNDECGSTEIGKVSQVEFLQILLKN